MLKFDVNTIYEDVCNWSQTAEALKAWTLEEMKKELADIIGDNKIIDENGEEITLEELAKMYLATAHYIGSELDNNAE